MIHLVHLPLFHPLNSPDYWLQTQVLTGTSPHRGRSACFFIFPLQEAQVGFSLPVHI